MLDGDLLSRAARLLRRAALRPDATGAVVAGWLFAQSLAPSLLLREWLYQGVLAGVSLAVGYWVGVALSRTARWVWRRTPWADRPDAALVARIRLVVLIALAVYVLAAIIRAVPQHQWTWERLGHEPATFGYVYLATVAVSLAVAGLLFVIGWGLATLWARLARTGARALPAWIASALALVLVAWVVLASLNSFVLQRTLDGMNATFAASDLSLDGAPEPPASTLRSGGPDSLIDWDRAGREGRRFLTRGPSPDEIADFATAGASTADAPTVEPIRVYVGRAQADDVDARIDVAVEELERTGAFDRQAVLIVVPTGTGWINEQLVQPLEYFYGGDVATVAVQYSHLPSPLAFLAEEQAAGDTGRALVAAVEERLRGLDDPPLLYIAGESLGSFGGARAFSSLDDSRARVAGALWVGPPETMHLRREAEERRVSGSPQIRPTVGDGTDFVFINRASDFAALPAGEPPHSIFLQQADDPIVWWDWETSYEEPDWLDEPLDPAVNPDLRWTPLTTFLQLAVDMAVSNDFDEEHGHLYGTLPLTAWNAIVRPGWDDAALQRLRDRLTTVRR